MSATDTASVFTYPLLRTRMLDKKDDLGVREAAKKALMTADAAALDLLKQWVPDAHKTLRTRIATSSKIFWALKCLETCELEVARMWAIKSQQYGDWSRTLGSALRDAMESQLDPSDRDNVAQHRSDITQAIRYMRALQIDVERGAATRQIASNRSKGKRRRAGTNAK